MPKTCPVCDTTYPDSDAFCPKDGTTLRTDESASTLVGSVIADRYLVSKLLGEGGMGQVYLAGHVRLPQQAAIKVLHASMVQDPGAVARFNREAANAARIEHERVARVFDFGETSNGLVYLAMEFVPGRTLRDVLDDTGRLHPVRAANIVYQVAEGLDAAHKISIVHRDLKPDNILVISDDGVDRCKVVDFGIAKAFDDSDSRKTQLTQAGAIIGTPEFMSPEQVLGEQLDARSDVYALAVVAYHLLTGALPFSAATPERSLTARLISDPLRLSESASDVEWPDELQAALDRALSREPETRTASALEFAEEMVAAVEGWTGDSVLRGRTPKSTATLTPRTGAVAGAAAAVNALRSAPTVGMDAPPPSVAKAAKAGAKGAPAATASSSPAAAGGAAKKSNTPMLAGVAVVLLAAVGGWFAMSGGSSTTGAQESVVASAADSIVASDGAPSMEASASASPGGGNAAAPQATAGTAPGASPSAPVASTGSQSTAPATATPAGAERPASGNAVPPAAAEPDAARAALEREFDAIKARLFAASEAEQATVARAEIPKLESLLTRYQSDTDKFWVYEKLVLPYAIVGDEVKTCSALRTANRLATSTQQVEAVMRLKSAFSDCL